MFAFATVHLGWSPQSFWASTPSEFWAAFSMFQQKIEAMNART
ncbi:phage tail assembly chaperone [Phaeobacter gallaeciensis]